MKSHIPRVKNIKGFTVTELIVVLALVAISSSVVIFNYNGSRQAVVLSATALDIANMLHVAQVGGRSASQNQANYNNTSELEFINNDTVRTGLAFTVSGGNVSALTVYRGIDGSMGYQNGAGDSILEQKNISTSGLVVRLCTTGVPVTPALCSGPNAYSTSTAIEFTRLNTDPVVEAGYEASLGTTNSPVIQIQSTAGTTTIYRYIVIENTGNIFVR